MKELFNELIKSINDADETRGESWRLQMNKAPQPEISKAEDKRVNALI